MAPHLKVMDRVFLETLSNPDSPLIVVIEGPPRHGKSEYWSKWAAAWYRCTFPGNRLILTSYEAFFAKQWGRKVRSLVEEHGHYFGVEIQADNRSASEWSIKGFDEGSMQTAGAGGALTGKGAHLLIVDDPIKNAEEARSMHCLDSLWDWWESTVMTRLEPGGLIILMATRWHERDPSGRVIDAAEKGIGEPITRIRFSALAEEGDILGRKPGEALWPFRYSRAKLEEMREGKSAYWWNALYQQRPTQHEGAEWPDEYFGDHLMTDYWPDAFDIFCVALDPSKGKTDRSDYSALVGVGLRGGELWVDADIKRRPVSKMVADGFWFCAGRQVDGFAIEANSFQDLLAPEFDRICRELKVPPLPIHLIQNTVNKEVRITSLGPWLARKKMKIRNNEGGKLLVRQLKEFPIGDHDDGPDSLEMALRLMADIGHQRVSRQSDEYDEYEVARV